MWTFISIFVLLAGIGAIVWYYAKEFDIWRRDGEPETGFAAQDFMDAAVITPSMRATGGISCWLLRFSSYRCCWGW